MADKTQYKVTLVKSLHGQLANIAASARGLGLRKIRQTVTVADTGTAIESVTLDYTLPAGVRLAGATGCPIMCALGPGATATVALHLVVDPTAWRTAPLRATVSAHAMVAGRPELPAASATATFTVLLPPGPPSPRVSLAAADLALPAGDGTAALTVRIGNTGPVPAQAALGVVTPDGTQVAAVPADCLASRRLGAHTDRCDVGRLDPGQRKALSFTLAVSPAALAQAPLSGAVMGYLTRHPRRHPRRPAQSSPRPRPDRSPTRSPRGRCP